MKHKVLPLAALFVAGLRHAAEPTSMRIAGKSQSR
jgi:hypothetical protein